MSKCPECGGRIKRKMKPGKGKAKGSSFERDICVALSLWVTHNERDDVFWRSSLSGGRATVRRGQGVDTAHVSGDICAVHELGNPFVSQFYVECKFRKDLNLDRLVTENTGSLVEYWSVARDEADHYRKFPMLIAKQNQHEPFVVIDLETAHLLQMTEVPELCIVPNLGMFIYTIGDLLDHGVFQCPMLS